MKSFAPSDLPSKYYLLRSNYADKIAACVLIAPELCPSHDELPREQIEFDPALRLLLAWASYTISPVKLSRKVLHEMGYGHLERWLCKTYFEASLMSWYVHKLKELVSISDRYYKAAGQIATELRAIQIEVRLSSDSNLKY